ncbi:MAG: response regulator [Acidobacteriia bacterium]|nr:response regulator [Terriglobia bacterium]MYG03914.1 response regulator [Terriglobia bacterium]MYK10867.1 response regulator [Terriglobia bacterium]
MKPTDDPQRENRALRERFSNLNAAILRINASLDLDTILSEAVESACDLTGARFGIITPVDEAGVRLDSVCWGLTPEQWRETAAWRDKVPMFEHLSRLPGAFRVANLGVYIRSVGLEPAPTFSCTFQYAPMRHRGAHVGHFYLAGKAGGQEFSDEDEEVVAQFASQVAAVVANAREYHGERRARARLEALVETSPVGVVVFDLQSGRPVSFNREARRIMESLRLPRRPPEQLLDLILCRRADDREISLGEFPLAQQPGKGGTVWAEEVELAAPNGRSVHTLVNSTPVQSPGEGVELAVMTLQDLAPLDEIERQRAEFLSLVSHELREPLTSVKGSAATLLEEGEALEAAERREFSRIIVEQTNHMRGLISDLLDAGRIGAGTLTVVPEPVEVAELVEPARSAFLSGGGRHGILVDLPAGLPRVMAERRRIVQVLGNLISNAARHAPDSSPIRLAAALEHAHVSISVTDEGRGVAPEQLPHLFSRHVAGKEGAPLGRGLGLAICKGLVEAHGGRIRADSAGLGRGATFTFTIPAAAEPSGAVLGRSGDPPRAAAGSDEPSRILVVDDDPQTLRFVRDALWRAGYAPLVTGVPEEIPHLIQSERPQLVLLDLLLPGSDGIELLGRVPELSDQPVIFISAYGRDETVARALESGAADYLVKPFSPTELVARVRAALRRHVEPPPFATGDLAIDYQRRRVTLGGAAVDLTATEYELLRLLSLHAGTVVTHQTLLRRVWARHDRPQANLVRIFVRNLRRKLGDSAGRPIYIVNERGVGYRMPAPGDL